MEYFIVMNEWLYPTESGRDFVGSFDTREEASAAAEKEWRKEYENFLEVNNGDYYSMASGKVLNHLMEPMSWQHHSSPDETEDMVFSSSIIYRIL